MKALILDDDEDVLAFAAEALHSFVPGFDVATARHVEEAILWMDVFHPDLLLVEPRLCGGSVAHIAATLLENDKTRSCKIVAFSDKPTREEQSESGEIGAHAILSKPVHLQDLLRTVQLVVGRQPGAVGRIKPSLTSSDGPSRTL